MGGRGTAVVTVNTSDAQWERKCQTLVREGKAFKVINLNTDEQRSFIVCLGVKFGVSIAHGEGVAYITQSELPPAKPFRPTGLKTPARRGAADGRQTKLFLVIEPDLDDATLIKRAFDSVDSCDAIVCRNLSEARAFLEGAGIYSNRSKYPLPNAIISELIVGTESVLTFSDWLSAAGFGKMPVYILTGVDSPRDLMIAKQSRAATVLQKPGGYSDLKAMLADLAAKLCSQ